MATMSIGCARKASRSPYATAPADSASAAVFSTVRAVHGDDLDAGNRARGADVRVADAAGADDADTHGLFAGDQEASPDLLVSCKPAPTLS